MFIGTTRSWLFSMCYWVMWPCVKSVRMHKSRSKNNIDFILNNYFFIIQIQSKISLVLNLFSSKSEILAHSLVDLQLDFIFVGLLSKFLVGAHHHDVDKDDEDSGIKQVPDHMILYLNRHKFILRSLQVLVSLVVADLGSILVTGTEGNSKIFTIKISDVSLIVDCDGWVRSHSHKVLPFSIHRKDAVLSRIVREFHTLFDVFDNILSKSKLLKDFHWGFFLKAIFECNDLSHANHVSEPQVIVDIVSIPILLAKQLSVQTFFSQSFLNDYLILKFSLEFCVYWLIWAVFAVTDAVLLSDGLWAVHAFKSDDPWGK